VKFFEEKKREEKKEQTNIIFRVHEFGKEEKCKRAKKTNKQMKHPKFVFFLCIFFRFCSGWGE